MNLVINLKNFLYLVIVSCLILIIVFLISNLTFFSDVNEKIYDLHYGELLNDTEVDSTIILLAIDDFALDYTRRNRITWPWPRTFYAHILNYLSASQAKKVIFDLQFYENDLNRIELSSQESDRIFAQSIEKMEEVYLGTQLTPEKLGKIEQFCQFALQQNIPKTITKTYRGVLNPIPELLKANPKIGIINIEPDNDGIIRRIYPFYSVRDSIFANISLSTFIDSNTTIEQTKSLLRLDNKNIPLDNNSKYRIRWYSNSDQKKSFLYYSMGAVLKSIVDKNRGVEPILKKNDFKDKYVIIGSTAGGLMDLKSTPTSKVLPGMEIWATVLRNINNNEYVKVPEKYISMLLAFIFILATLISFNRSHKLISYIIIVAFVGIIFSLDVILWSLNSVLFPTLLLLISIILSYIVITTINYFTEGKEKKKLKRIFSRYLHPDIIDNLIVKSGDIELGGDEIEATVFFTDIADFTTYSENKKPKEVVNQLNRYFNEIVKFVLKNDGLLDKYTGDGIMAIFGAPLEQKDHAYLACKTALEYKKNINNSINKKFMKSTRIGIDSGPIVAGNIGSYKRMDYTAIGDVVNTAARLEGVNKIYKTEIIISEKTHKLVKNDFLCRKLDQVKVKGKNIAIYIYELIDFNRDNEIPEWITLYERGLELYQKKQIDKSLEIFKKVLKNKKNDFSTMVMIERCQKFKKNKDSAWNGIFNLEVK